MATRIQQLSNLLRQFSNGIAAFCQDLGDRMEDIVLVTMSEFGRTVEENGNAGTDHGHGSMMMVLGGAVQGGKVYGKWPGLEKEQLYEGRDLAVTTDFRTVLSDLVRGHLGQSDLNAVFPGFQPGAAAWTPALIIVAIPLRSFVSSIASSRFGNWPCSLNSFVPILQRVLPKVPGRREFLCTANSARHPG